MSTITVRLAIIGLVCLLAGNAGAQSSAAPEAAPATPSAPAVVDSAPPSAPETSAEHASASADVPRAAPSSGSAPPPAPAPDSSAPAVDVPRALASFLAQIQIHGFVSEGGFISTANDFIGKSSRGSLKFFEAALNVSSNLTDRLRVGLQLVARSVGTLSQELPRVDWALVDYRLRPWLGLRAGVIKMPLGLYNEYIAVDAARTPILLPQALYPLRNRDAVFSHTGFAAYGSVGLGVAGGLDYQAWVGTLTIPRSALDLTNATLDSTDTKYVTGAQMFWRTPLEGLRVGATYLRASIDFNLTLDPETVSQLTAAGLVASDYHGQLLVAQRPTSWWVASAEYIHGDWLFAFEYLRGFTRQQSSLPELLPTTETHKDSFYGMVTYRPSDYVELGGYYSVNYADANDRRGHGPGFSTRSQAFQRDLAATLRIDVNQYWLWKVEGHFIDGTSELQASANPNPTRYWGLFLLRTTVTF